MVAAGATPRKPTPGPRATRDDARHRGAVADAVDPAVAAGVQCVDPANHGARELRVAGVHPGVDHGDEDAGAVGEAGHPVQALALLRPGPFGATLRCGWGSPARWRCVYPDRCRQRRQHGAHAAGEGGAEHPPCPSG